MIKQEMKKERDRGSAEEKRKEGRREGWEILSFF